MVSVKVTASVAAALLLGAASMPAQTAKPDALKALREGFLNPPDAAKPMVRWWWFGPAVVKPEILRELQQMKADGIGGAELAFVYAEVLDDPAKGLKNLPFLSPEMLDAVNYAQAEGRKLGLRIDVTLCSGWPYGGPAITLDQAVTRLRTVEVAVEPGATMAVPPSLAAGETLLGAALVNGRPNPPARRGPPAAAPAANTWDAATAKPLPPGGAFAAGVTPRVALFFVQSHTKQEVKRAAVGAEGYVLDPFSAQAVKTHLDNVGEPLVKAFGANPPYAIFSDSLEAYGADWTPRLPEEFKKRRGYDLMEHLPELVGGGSAAADKVRHDYGRTLTELVNESYLTQINDWAKAHKTQFRSQTYGEPAVSFSSQNLVGLAEGEGPQWRQFSTLRWATSANHVFGHNVTSGETFTWLHSPVFRATPLDMKAEADIDFIMGENQLIYHGWPYSPPVGEVPEPGWSLYAAASFNDHNPWHPVEPAVNKYIQRLSYVMRQGDPANQVAILLPTDDAWAGFSPGHTTVTGAMQKLVAPELMAAILSAGYNIDFIDAEAIDKVGFGTHQILVLPPTDRIPLATLKKIDGWARGTGKVISVGRLPSLDAEGAASGQIASMTKAMVLVPDAGSLGQALHNAMVPDFSADTSADTRDVLGFVHRKLPAADIYFVVNNSNRSVSFKPTFAAAEKTAEIWDPDSGTWTSAANGLDTQLAPYGSKLYVFGPGRKLATREASSSMNMDLSTEWKVSFTGLAKSVEEKSLTDWTSDPQTLHYSGEAIYSRDFALTTSSALPVFLAVEGGSALPGSPQSAQNEHVLLPNGLPDPRVTRTGPGMHAYYDPPIREAALVFINGKEAGALWHAPYRLEVSKLLKSGQNHIEIRVYNTALNAWSALPSHDYKPLIQKYGDKFQMQDLDKVQPISSGILGTIKLVTEGVQ